MIENLVHKRLVTLHGVFAFNTMMEIKCINTNS